jgi:hypothetical protein
LRSRGNPVNRRDLLLLRIDRSTRSFELSCESLYMRYCDSQLNDTTQELFGRLEAELRAVDELRLVDSIWLTREDFRKQLEPLLLSIRSRGGRVIFQRAPASDRIGLPRTV